MSHRYLVSGRITGQPVECGSRIVRIDRHRCHHDTKDEAIAFAKCLDAKIWCDPHVITQESDSRLFDVEKVE